MLPAPCFSAEKTQFTWIPLSPSTRCFPPWCRQ
nr:MAG TPA: hypothetical protein [Caudoviricetes sp.]